MTQSKCVGELLESLVSECDTVLTHINIKHIQSVKLTWNILMFMFYKLILQRVTIVSIKMTYRVPCGAATVSCFSPQNWPINQYVKYINCVR